MAFKVIKENILKANDNIASEIRAAMTEKNIFMINLISSPGAGKTSLLEKIGPKLASSGISLAILTGDCFTSRDAERLDAHDLEVVQINTGNACHIDAQLVQKSIEEINTDGLDFIIVENVGNLVCPAEFDVGEDEKIAILSTPEGEDKPEKYPLLFVESSAVIINKVDLLENVDFDIEYCESSIRNINSKAELFKVSCKTGEGIEDFIEWLRGKLNNKKERTR